MKPIDLYRLTIGSDVWAFTSSDAPVVYNSERYMPVAIGRGTIESKNELSKANLEVRLDITHELSVLLMTNFLEQIAGLTLFTKTDAGTETVWKGRLSNLKPTVNALVMYFESVFTSLRRPGLRARYQRSCRHALYYRGCGLDPEAFAILANFSAVSNSTVTVPDAASYDDQYFLGGMLRAPDGSLGYIISHVGSSIILQRPIASLAQVVSVDGYGNNYGNYYGGAAVTLYPGCDHTRAACKDKFDNLPNFGGFPWIPTKNPLGGTSIV